MLLSIYLILAAASTLHAHDELAPLADDKEGRFLLSLIVGITLQSLPETLVRIYRGIR